MKKFIYLLLIIPLFFTSCADDDNEPKFAELPDISVVDISQESEWDYWVAGKKDYYYIKANSSRTLPEAVLFHSSQDNKDYSIFFTNNGKVDKVVVDDFIFVFRNFNGNHVDIGVISPSGEIETFREVETPNYNWDNLSSNKLAAKETSDVVRLASRAVAGIPCAISVVAAVGSGGIAIPAMAWACGNYLLSLSVDIAINEGNIHNGFTDFVGAYGAYSTYSSCNSGQVTSCLSGLASTALSEWADDLEEIENRRSDDVRITVAALEHGYGDVQITLTWDNGADLDLHVIDPNGEEIWWNHTYSVSDGKLDVDDIDGYGPENIFWPRLKAPDGTYKVYIHHYPWDNKPKSSNYTVLINAFGVIKKYTGSITENQVMHIKDFNQNGFKSIINKNSFSITTNAIK